MLNDDIYHKLLKYTIANWSVNGNNTATLGFLETNSTKKLTTDYTANIDITQYMSPFDPWTNMIMNFSHIILAINPQNEVDTTTQLFSISYQNALIGKVISLAAVISFTFGLIM